MAISSIPTRVPKPCINARTRTLDQFESRQEVLFALRDAIAGESYPPCLLLVSFIHFYSAHQVQWNATQVAHGNVSVDTICIGDADSPGARGFLIGLEESTVCLSLPVYNLGLIFF